MMITWNSVELPVPQIALLVSRFPVLLSLRREWLVAGCGSGALVLSRRRPLLFTLRRHCHSTRSSVAPVTGAKSDSAAAERQMAHKALQHKGRIHASALSCVCLLLIGRLAGAVSASLR